MKLFDYKALITAPLQRDPFEFIIVRDFVPPASLDQVNADFPWVPGPGSHPPSVLDIHGHFKALLAELDSESFRNIVELKFNIDLRPFATMSTVRGFLRKTDGKIHTDSETKVITVLLYLNAEWSEAGGRLRLLRSGTDDFATEIAPDHGTLLVFRRSGKSWHGHEPYAGPRRAVQFNWVTSADVAEREQRKHAYSSRLKQIAERVRRPLSFFR
jgi:SM-20-related protein